MKQLHLKPIVKTRSSNTETFTTFLARGPIISPRTSTFLRRTTSKILPLCRVSLISNLKCMNTRNSASTSFRRRFHQQTSALWHHLFFNHSRTRTVCLRPTILTRIKHTSHFSMAGCKICGKGIKPCNLAFSTFKTKVSVGWLHISKRRVTSTRSDSTWALISSRNTPKNPRREKGRAMNIAINLANSSNV